MPRRIPYAVANYEKLVSGEYHFVDKTRFIRDLELYELPVFLRPRRFGKSLWCSLLECYYDLNRADQFEGLFGQTDIGNSPTPSHNTLMVLSFDFSIVALEKDIERLEARFNRVCLECFKTFICQYPQLKDFPLEGSASEIMDAILKEIERKGLPPVMVIVDEYDNFTNQLLTTGQDHLYGALTTGDSFLRTFYKTIKTGVGKNTVARAFITGVLPVTMDDMTSGFNIGQIITLKEHTLEMMGFTQPEVEDYVDQIFSEHEWTLTLKNKVLEDLKAHYNGYRLLPEATPLYNSTICNFYLNDLVISNGKIPRELTDVNLKVDISWLRRLTGGEDSARELVEQLVFDNGCNVDATQLQSQFNKSRFVEPEFFALSLYYLGLLSFEDRFRLRFPNLTVKTLFLEYFNELKRIQVSTGYTDMFRSFLNDHSVHGLFAGYWERYIGQIPAQAFDKTNENFFRTTFYEICTRYLSPDFSFAIEVNRPSGRSDFEAIGRAGSAFEGKGWVIEFKHFTVDQARRLGVEEWTEARLEDAEQVKRYRDDVLGVFPELGLQCHVFYTLSSRGFRCFEVKA